MCRCASSCLGIPRYYRNVKYIIAKLPYVNIGRQSCLSACDHAGPQGFGQVIPVRSWRVDFPYAGYLAGIRCGMRVPIFRQFARLGKGRWRFWPRRHCPKPGQGPDGNAAAIGMKRPASSEAGRKDRCRKPVRARSRQRYRRRHWPCSSWRASRTPSRKAACPRRTAHGSSGLPSSRLLTRLN